ncbi:hypothetical protein C1H46_025431 [Malus baccata]|uniref:Uncharacterized protein n=1 Tax=Malus baccata TaxID=106549 RepID=A0A540LRC4_MALBA|nr:hypothetical protein C1H46_025431 [Malus baccata]
MPMNRHQPQQGGDEQKKRETLQKLKHTGDGNKRGDAAEIVKHREDNRETKQENKGTTKEKKEEEEIKRYTAFEGIKPSHLIFFFFGLFPSSAL